MAEQTTVQKIPQEDEAQMQTKINPYIDIASKRLRALRKKIKKAESLKTLQQQGENLQEDQLITVDSIGKFEYAADEMDKLLKSMQDFHLKENPPIQETKVNKKKKKNKKDKSNANEQGEIKEEIKLLDSALPDPVLDVVNPLIKTPPSISVEDKEFIDSIENLDLSPSLKEFKEIDDKESAPFDEVKRKVKNEKPKGFGSRGTGRGKGRGRGGFSSQKSHFQASNQ